jgi:Holliday junction resolvase RusA-like endonuclease
MNEPIVIEVAGEARPFQKKTMSWQAKDGRSGTHAYDSSKYAGWKDHARLAASHAMMDKSTGEVRAPIDYAVSFRIDVYFSIPASASKRQRALMIANMVRPCKTPDADNIAKACQDSMIGIALRDDKFVADLHVHKWWSERPRVVIRICEAKVVVAPPPTEQTPLFAGKES